MKLFLVVIKDKALPGEPDVELAVVEGNEAAADIVRKEMVRACIAAGRASCVGRYREIQRSKRYQITSLVTPPQRLAQPPASPPAAERPLSSVPETDDRAHRIQLRQRVLDGHVDRLRRRHPDWPASRVIHEAERLTGQV